MRKFNDFDKDLASYVISNGSLGCCLEKCNSIVKVFDDNAALLVVNEQETYVFFSDKEKKEKCVSSLVSMLSIFDFLSKNRLIYIVPNQSANILLYQNETRRWAKVPDGRLNYDNGYIRLATIPSIQDRFGVDSIKGEKLPQSLSKPLAEIFSSNIYSTQSLIDLRNNKYESIEIQSLKHQRRTAVISSIFAWIIAIGTCLWNIYMTKYNNEHAKTELKEEQYKGLTTVIHNNLQEMEDIETKIDFIIEKRDKQDSLLRSLQMKKNR